MKRILVIVLSVTVWLFAAPLTGFTAINLPEIKFSGLLTTDKAAEIVASGTCGEVDEEKGLDGSQVTWTLDSDGLLTISGTGEMNNDCYKERKNARQYKHNTCGR